MLLIWSSFAGKRCVPPKTRCIGLLSVLLAASTIFSIVEYGNTRFQDVTVDLRKTNFAPPAPPIHIGSDFAASRAFFGGFDAGWGARDLENRLNHPTPATQFGIVLQGVFSITTTDGETRRLPPGSVFRLEDTSPCKGHITVVGDQPGFLMFVR